MKPSTSIILTAITIGVGYEYIHSINAKHRINDYKKVTVNHLDLDVLGHKAMGKKLLADPVTILQALREIPPETFDGYEFEDVIILADDNFAMTRIYNDKVVKRCIPPFMKRT